MEGFTHIAATDVCAQAFSNSPCEAQPIGLTNPYPA